MEDEEKKLKLAAAKKKLKQVKKQTLNDSSNYSNGISKENRSAKKIKSEQNNESIVPLTNSNIHISNHIEDNSQRIPTVSTEKLNIISRQVSDLAHNSSAYINGGDNVFSERDFMERRIQELAHLLEEQRRFADEKNSQLEEIRNENERLKENMDSDRKISEDKWKKDYASLKEQLQVHIQTIGILVAEKTELQSAHNQILKVAESKHQEIEDLAGRLRASRQRLADLERDSAALVNNNKKLEKTNKDLTKDIDKLKLDSYKNNKSSEELKQHNLELQSKLQLKMNEVVKLEDEAIEMKGKLEMAQLHLQQIQNAQEKPEGNTTKQIEKILTEKTELLTKVQQLEDSLRAVRRERDGHSQQYNQLVERLQSNNMELTDQLNRVTEERDFETKLRRDLEESLERLKNIHVEDPGNENKENKEEILLISEKLKETTLQYENLVQAFNQVNLDNQQLGRQLEDREKTIFELELLTKQLQESVSSHAGLLDTIQSDKTALSRATAQNKDLKQQIHELQDQFVKMSTENMDLTTQLQTEQHNLKEQMTKLANLEEERAHLQALLISKDEKLSDCLRTLSVLNEQQTNMSTMHGQQQHIIVESLQQKLHSAMDAIATLTSQNSELQNQIVGIEQMTTSNGIASSQVDHLNFQISQLEAERNSLIEQLAESQKLQNLLKEKLIEMQHNLSSSVPATMNGNVVTKIQFEALQNSMFQLEEKYKRVIEDKASLMELTDRQEHIILQLEGESDTIGEYVSLYQQQRTLLRQRAAEKDSYIIQISHERSDMQRKLTQLQNLVVQLLDERQLDLSLTNGKGKVSPDISNMENGDIVNREVTIVNGHEHDWPDYSDEESETFQDSKLKATPLSSQKQNIESGTARKIMHLLNEIGGSREHNIMPCPHCHGQLIIV